jgi:hypothetical protein
VERHGRPVSFYTDKAAMFHTTPKVFREPSDLSRDERQPAAPAQLGRALRELGIVWIAAHSPQAGQKRPGHPSRLLAQGLRASETPPKKVRFHNQNPLEANRSPPNVRAPADAACANQWLVGTRRRLRLD